MSDDRAVTTGAVGARRTLAPFRQHAKALEAYPSGAARHLPLAGEVFREAWQPTPPALRRPKPPLIRGGGPPAREVEG